MSKNHSSRSSASLSSADLIGFARTCANIGEECVDTTGFVPIERLVARFAAKLVFRPLLVEAMLGHLQTSSRTDSNPDWCVVIDSETLGSPSKTDLATESAQKPLPARLRNTVAHELVHSLAFRISEFGVRLTRKLDSRESKVAALRALEDETERLSPLLLIPTSALSSYLASLSKPLDAQGVAKMAAHFGVSRAVLITRLNWLVPLGESSLLLTPQLVNVAFGLAEMIDGKGIWLRGHPMFLNFQRGISPSFLPNLAREGRASLQSIGAEQALLFGEHNRLSFDAVVKAGVDGRANAGTMMIRVSLESKPHSDRRPVIFVIRRID